MYRLALLFSLLAGAIVVLAADPVKPYQADVKPASKEPERAVKNFRIPQGMDISLWAAEPLLANPVIFCIDHKNRFYVAETFRLHQGVTDIRSWLRAGWLDDDLACRTVEDRLDMMKRRLGKKFTTYNVHHDRVRLVEDTKGAGKADRSTVFADGFNRHQDGIGAGLLARGKDVYYTCIPDLWLLRDKNGDGKADERKSLSTGYGVRFGFIGHDLHGLVMGPDGKIYFSIGDRGLNVKTPNGHLFYPDTGSVLRCNLDGSELEVFASGLRNPQELAFDDHGNLFTGDNNSDGGDRARWVYVVEGGDSGWRIGYQFGGVQSNRGPWNAEKLWHPQHAGQPAWHIPPITNLGNGPSGLAYYPGVGLPEKYQRHFLMTDFRGQPGGSVIHAFTNKAKGAGFELTGRHDFARDILATDVDFGTDGAVYVSDWVSGWGLTGKGRIWRISDPKSLKNPLVAETKRLLAEGFDSRKPGELAKLLAHADRRVRQEAQFALVAKGKDGIAELNRVAKDGKPLAARLHAVWGLGQVARKSAERDTLSKLLTDSEPEVRAQAARVLGEARDAKSAEALVSLLKDEQPRVRFFAAQALAKIGDKVAVPSIVAMLRDNDDKDVYLRHAGVRALAGCADEKTLAEVGKDKAASARRAALLALRMKGSAGVAQFLDDTDAEIVTEAARAINDVPIDAAMPKLAALIARRGLSESLGYRVLNAHFRLGTADHAKAIARFAARSGEKESLRVEAIKELELWSNPPGRDRVMGVWRPLAKRPEKLAVDAFKASMGGMVSGPGNVRKEAARVAAKLGVKDIGPALFATVSDKNQPALVRVETLRSLQTLKDSQLDKAVKLALADGDPRLRAEGRRVLSANDPAAALESMKAALEKGELVEKQQAFDVLGSMKGEAVQKVLLTWLDRLIDGKVPAEARLDLIEAAERHKDKAIEQKLAAYEKTRAKGEPFGKWRESLTGGDAEAGRQIFLHKAEVSCLRCHKAGGDGTGEVGPDLTGIAMRQKRDYLLEAIVLPNKQIAKGFETVELLLDNGRTASGILKSEDGKEVRLMTAEGQTIVVPKKRIEERRSGKSAMPEDIIKHLSRREVRDLVEFLASLKEMPKK